MQLFIAAAGCEEVEGLDTYRVDRMTFRIQSLTILEVLQMLEVLLDEDIHIHVYLADIQSGSHLEEGGYAYLEIRYSHITVPVGHELGKLLPQADLVLQCQRLSHCRREDEVDEFEEFCVLVHQVAYFVADDKAELIVSHKVDEA